MTHQKCRASWPAHCQWEPAAISCGHVTCAGAGPDAERCREASAPAGRWRAPQSLAPHGFETPPLMAAFLPRPPCSTHHSTRPCRPSLSPPTGDEGRRRLAYSAGGAHGAERRCGDARERRRGWPCVWRRAWFGARCGAGRSGPAMDEPGLTGPQSRPRDRPAALSAFGRAR